MNFLINAGMDTSGRIKRIEERQGWAKLIPAHPLVIVKSEYKQSIDKLIDSYEADIKSVKGDKKSISHTALLLRDVLDASISGAKMRIEAHYRNTGSLMHVAAGLDRLIGLDQFDKERGRFAQGAGADWRLVGRAVRLGGYPRSIILVDKGAVYRGREVLNRLTAHYV